MTWHETHQRTRIIHEVEAAAAVDPTGALPWKDEWSAYFAGPAGLVIALRSRWHQMCEAQLDPDASLEEFHAAYERLRRRHEGVLRILARHADQPVEPAAAVGKLRG